MRENLWQTHIAAPTDLMEAYPCEAEPRGNTYVRRFLGDSTCTRSRRYAAFSEETSARPLSPRPRRKLSKFAQLSAPAGCKANVETRFCDASMQRGQLSTSFWRRTLPAVVLLVLHSGLDTQLNNAQDAATCLRDRTGPSLCWPKRLRITARIRSPNDFVNPRAVQISAVLTCISP